MFRHVWRVLKQIWTCLKHALNMSFRSCLNMSRKQRNQINLGVWCYSFSPWPDLIPVQPHRECSEKFCQNVVKLCWSGFLLDGRIDFLLYRTFEPKKSNPLWNFHRKNFEKWAFQWHVCWAQYWQASTKAKKVKESHNYSCMTNPACTRPTHTLFWN